jgi:hypothetical protein
MSVTVATKYCTGPAHDRPVLLPATEKYFYVRKSVGREGELVSRCRLCCNWEKLKSPGLSGWVPIHVAFPFFREGVNRVGLAEFCRRTNIATGTIEAMFNGNTKFVQKRTLRRCMLEVISMRRKGEVRHKDSISCGASKRGWKEKIPKNRKDLYRSHGALENEYQRKSRRLAS